MTHFNFVCSKIRLPFKFVKKLPVIQVIIYLQLSNNFPKHLSITKHN